MKQKKMNKIISDSDIRIHDPLDYISNNFVYADKGKATYFLIGKNIYNKYFNKKFISILTSPQTCRELTIGQFKLALFKGHFPEIFLNYESTDIRTVVHLTGLKDPMFLQRAADISLKILNILEDALGWSPSHTSIVKHETLCRTIHMISFESCAKYFEFTEILSLYLLLLRIGCNERLEKFFIDIQTKHDLIEALERLSKFSFRNADLEHIIYYKIWFRFLYSLKEIYKDISVVDSYSKTDYSRNGITNFCKNHGK